MAIAEWARDLTVLVRDRLGLGRVVPEESTIRRALQSVDADALDRAVSGWLAARVRRTGLWALSVDGKTARGARRADGRAVHLLAALDSDEGVVLGQVEVDGKSNEITAFAPLLDRIDISGAVVTADALLAQVSAPPWADGPSDAVTDLGVEQIRPDQIADIIRRHRHIENRLCATRRLIAFPAQPGGIRRCIPGSDGSSGSER